jgi:hypothetical protein
MCIGERKEFSMSDYPCMKPGGQPLGSGDRVISPLGLTIMTFTQRGLFITFLNGAPTPIWQGTGANACMLNQSGQLVITGPAGTLWTSPPVSSCSGLDVQDNGHVDIYSPSGLVVQSWAASNAPSMAPVVQAFERLFEHVAAKCRVVKQSVHALEVPLPPEPGPFDPIAPLNGNRTKASEDRPPGH